MLLSRKRIPFAVAFPAFYVGVAAVRSEDARGSGWLLVVAAVLIALVGGRVPEGMDPTAVRRRLWTVTGLSVAIATAALVSRPAWAAIAREVGTAIAMVGALRALGEIDGDVGLASKATEAASAPGLAPRHLVRAAIAIVIIFWTTAALVDVTTWMSTPSFDGHAVVMASSCGALALFTVGGTALLLGGARRLELEVPPRALACAGAAGAGLVLAVILALTDSLTPDGAIALGGAAACGIIVRLARAEDPLKLARRGRRTLALVIFGGPVVALAALAVEGRLPDMTGIALALAVVALLVGASIAKLEEPFLPVKGILIDAMRDARAAAREREARSAMAHALVRIREASAVGMGPHSLLPASGGPTAAPSPELWLLHPSRVLTVNAAGYLQERPAEVPQGIFDLALGEPHATLRTSVLRALEVRRADLRPLLAWLDNRDALFATVIAESDDPDGLLVVPVGARTDELTLEEARGAKQLADAFVAVSQAQSAKVRHLERERDLKDRIDALDEERERLLHAQDLDVGRHTLASTRLARPATVGIYSAVARMAFDALERRIAQDAPTVVVARAGIDPVPYIARAHLSGPRKNGPLVVVDGTASREHDLARWTDPRTSPLALADRGLLLLVDGPALPRDVQVLVARSVAERRPPWERGAALDVTIALTSTLLPNVDAWTTDTFVALVESGRLVPELAARFEAADAIVLPGLSERPEDLRSIVADRLAREGLRVIGRPLGIDAGAFGRLVEYPFTGEDAELSSIVTKLVARMALLGQDVVHARDVAALVLEDVPAEPESPFRRARE